MESRKNLIKKAKPISLSPASDNIKMWSETESKSPSHGDPKETNNTSHSDKQPNPIGVVAANSPEKEKKENPLEATFTPPEPLEGAVIVAGKKSGNKKQKSDYRALEFASSTSNTNEDSLTISINGEDKHLTDEFNGCEDEHVLTSLLALFFSLFGPLFSLGMAYWHFSDGTEAAALLTIAILAISIITFHAAYMFTKSSPKSKIWKSSKLIWFLCAIPGAPSSILAVCNVVFAIREKQSRSYERCWRNTRYLFLTESLVLAFPQTLLQLVLISEDTASIPSYKGLCAAIGASIFSLQITFSRFRYDSQLRYERFGTGIEKGIRFFCIWANKVLWLVTFTLVILSLRISFPMHRTVSSIMGIGLMLALHEFPLLLIMSPALSRAAGNLVEILMMIPQFVSLSALIVWVNLNPSVYNFNNGSLLLGLFFWTETVILTGWLYDRCTGRDIDFIPVYPHFFGDISTSLRE